MSMLTFFVALLFIIAGGFTLIYETGLFLAFLILCATGFIIFELGCIIEFLGKSDKQHPHRIKIKCKHDLLCKKK